MFLIMKNNVAENKKEDVIAFAFVTSLLLFVIITGLMAVLK